LMAAGSYGGDYAHPATPTQMCAWSKEEMGWLEPKEIVCDETVALYYQGDTPEAVKIWTGGDYSQNEWFLVENRQRIKWDKYLLGTGFLITHIDNEVLTQNDEACPGGNPCPQHYQVMVIEADGQWEMQTAAAPLAGPWFGESEDFFSAENNDTWTDTTSPSSRDHDGNLTGISVTNISSSGEKMFADFSVSQICQGTPDIAVSTSSVSGGCDLDGFLDPGEEVSLSVTLRNAPTASPATGVSGTLTSLHPDVSVTSGTVDFPDLGQGEFGETIIPFQVMASAAAMCSTFADIEISISADGGYSSTDTVTLSLGIDSLYVPFALFEDDMESGDENGWRHYAYVNEDDWSHNTNGNNTTGAIPGSSWFTEAKATGKDVSLEPPGFIPSATSVVSFWHRYDTEDDWDGCLLELSLDGGDTWIDVGDSTNVGYDDQLTANPQSTIGGRRAWNGLSASYPLFDQVTLDMSPWAGQTCILRFRLGCDLAATGTVVPGWNIDDYSITDASILREQCEATSVCTGIESDPPVFAGLESAKNINAPGCDVVDLKWSAATDPSGPVTYLIYQSTTTPVPTTAPVASTSLLKYRVEGLTPNQNYYFLVRARDSQGNVENNAVEQTVSMTCDPPSVVVRSLNMVEFDGCDGDQSPDGGETLDLSVTLRNASGTDAKNIQSTLTSLSSNVIVLDDTGLYGDLNAQHFEEGDQPFRVYISAGATCLEPATLELSITADGGYAVTRTIDLVLESDVDFSAQQFFDDMEGVEPNGFTHFADVGSDAWGYTSSDAFSGASSWFHGDTPSETDASLVSPPLYISPSSVLTFWHKYVLESTYDGGVLEISVDGGDTWEDIGQSYNSSMNVLGPAFGGPFAPGRAFWSGSSGGFVQETVNLGAMTSPLGTPLYAGQIALIRWRIGCDNTNTSPPHEGWWIDDISLTDTGTFTTVCDSSTPCGTLSTDNPTNPRVTMLAQNAPNPMAAAGTRIQYQIGVNDDGPVSLRVYSLSGRLIDTIVEERQLAGMHEAFWDGTTSSGVRVPAGIYFYELRTGSERQVRRLALLR
ncbi:MAG: hypothetical protein HKN21_12970, partial [Candidatus Eisenbacteria bacterium]|nr:hypothetical protein [Candidatus Eisenbacteria bacterium]